MIFLITYSICCIFNYVYFMFQSLHKKNSIKVKDLFNAENAVWSIFGYLITSVIILVYVGELVEKIANIELRKPK